MSRARLTIALAATGALAMAGLLAWPPGAVATRGLTTGFADPLLYDADPRTRAMWIDRGLEAGAGLELVYVSWRGITTGEPANPADPADPAYSFDGLDAAVRNLNDSGLEVMLAITFAPDFAEGPDRPANAAAGTWKPDPQAFGDFGEALARRYSGSFVPAGAASPVPRVGLLQAWTEPNLGFRLTPQFDSSGAPFAPIHYRLMLNSFYKQVKAVSPAATIVGAGAAPYGDPHDPQRMTPLRFWRRALCLRDRRRLLRTPCPRPAKLDVFAHNAITNPFGPRTPAELPDNASTADLGKLRRVLRAAERHHTVLGPRRHPLWATEIWWETKPPNRTLGVRPSRQARWTQQALYVLWKEGARVVVNLQIRDDPFDPTKPEVGIQAGLFFENGKAKPSFTAFRFPFVVETKGNGRVIAWGRSPATGRLRIERRVGGGWRPLESVRLATNDVFTERLRLSGSQELRARIAGETSLTWTYR